MKAFTDEQLANMKSEFIELINSIEREGFKKDALLAKLESSDFYVAPASTKFHNHIKGGLLDHSLNVYYNLKSLVERKGLKDKISEDSIKIVGLLHDLAKINYYKIFYKNEKHYSDYGSKRDEGGKFDWVAVQGYTTLDDSEKFIFGNHEQTCQYMISVYVPLTYVESIAILHHHGGKGYDSAPDNVNGVFNRYPLAVLLHIADMLSAYIDESYDESVY